MRKAAIRTIHGILRRFGCDPNRYRPKQKQFGRDPFKDIRHFLKGVEEPTIVDVGANIGQSAMRFLHDFPGAQIHSFEPSPSTFEKLRTACSSCSQVRCWNYGVGSQDGILEFLENEHSDMSSFLAPSTSAWGAVTNKTDVRVVTLDSFANEHDIHDIHLLKSDTQGFDFEVFKGARRLIDERKIGLIYCEFIFSDMYTTLPLFDDVLRYLREGGFRLVSFYDFHFQNDLASWADALFISGDYYGKRMRDTA